MPNVGDITKWDGSQWIVAPGPQDGAQGPQGEQGPAGQDANISAAWPIGSVFPSVVDTNPATLLGFGTWVEIGAGRVLVGKDAADPDFDTLEETGGAKTHTLTETEMPAHTHGLARFPTTTGGSSGFTADTSMSGTPAAVTQATASAGGGQPHNNLQPYLVVRFWKRTA